MRISEGGKDRIAEDQPEDGVENSVNDVSVFALHRAPMVLFLLAKHGTAAQAERCMGELALQGEWEKLRELRIGAATRVKRHAAMRVLENNVENICSENYRVLFVIAAYGFTDGKRLVALEGLVDCNSITIERKLRMLGSICYDEDAPVEYRSVVVAEKATELIQQWRGKLF